MGQTTVFALHLAMWWDLLELLGKDLEGVSFF